MPAKKTAKKAATSKKTPPASKKATAPATTPAKLAPTVTPSVPAVVGSQAAYEQFLAAALALPAGNVTVCRADASLAYHNVSVGLASLVAKETQARALPDTDVDALLQLPNQCLAVVFAVGQQAQAAGAPAGQIAATYAQAAPLRSKLFAGADALVASGLLPANAVATLRAGKGKRDAASDLDGLAALFRANAAAIKGKTAITAADLTAAATLGGQLLTMVKPTNAKKVKPADAVKAANIRDRLWSLVLQGYDSLWGACAYLYGPHDLAARVPALQAHVATTSARKKANKAKKAAAPAAAKPATPPS